MKQILSMLVLVVCCLIACNHASKLTSIDAKQSSQNTISEDSGENILFFTFKIFKDSTTKSGENISLVKTQKVKGHLKLKLNTNTLIQPEDLICEFLDKKNTILATEILEDPLTASIEYPDENGSFKRINIDKKEADLLLRIQYNPLFYKLRISKVMPDGRILIISDLLI